MTHAGAKAGPRSALCSSGPGGFGPSPFRLTAKYRNKLAAQTMPSQVGGSSPESLRRLAPPAACLIHTAASDTHVPSPLTCPLPGYPEAEIESKQQQITPIRSQREIEGLRAACRLGRTILDACVRAVRPGVTTDEIDAVAHEARLDGFCCGSPRRLRTLKPHPPS